MKKHFECIMLFMVLLLAGCSPTVKKDEFVGVWINEKENSKIQFNKDFTFTSTNLPSDVVNRYFLPLDKLKMEWKGVWSVENKEIKLTSNNYHYCLYVTTHFFQTNYKFM